MNDILRDLSANLPFWSLVVATIAAVVPTVSLIAYHRHRGIDQTARDLRDRDEHNERLRERVRELEKDLNAARSENLKIQIDRLRDMVSLTDDSRQDISIAFESDDTDETTDETDQDMSEPEPDV